MRSKVALYRDNSHPAPGVPADDSAMSEDYDDEEDFPQVPLEELVEQMNHLGMDQDDEESDLEQPHMSAENSHAAMDYQI